MLWTSGKSLLGKKVRAKDGLLVGKVDDIEVDVGSWNVKSLHIEASRAALEALHLDEPSVTGGRPMVLEVEHIEEIGDEITLVEDLTSLPRLSWHTR